MRTLTIVGIVLVLAGAFVAIRGATITTQREVVSVGNLRVTADKQYPLLPWVGGLAVLGGITLVAVGLLRKT